MSEQTRQPTAGPDRKTLPDPGEHAGAAGKDPTADIHRDVMATIRSAARQVGGFGNLADIARRLAEAEADEKPSRS